MTVFGSAGQTPTQILKTGLVQARRVGRVDIKSDSYEGPLGSGFLVDGSIFYQAFDRLPIFVTAGHLIGSSSVSAVGLSDVTIVFEGMFDDTSPRITAKCHQILAESPRNELNYTLLLLDRWPGTVADLLLAPQRPEAGSRVFVISYPRGGGLAISLYDNEVVAPPSVKQESSYPARKLDPARHFFYRAPTEAGSSGGAVFNRNWEIVGIHNGGLKELGRNFGVAFDAVVPDARSRLEGKSISNELAASIRATSQSGAESDPHYFSVFISYSHADTIFANRLYNALQARGIRAWLDIKQMRPGDDIYEEVEKGIQHWDKVLLCASEASLTSWWVDSEIERLFEKEQNLFKDRKAKVLALIPLIIDDFMLTQWKSGKASVVKRRVATDFRGWNDQTRFTEAFERLVDALDVKVRESPPESKL